MVLAFIIFTSCGKSTTNDAEIELENAINDGNEEEIKEAVKDLVEAYLKEQEEGVAISDVLLDVGKFSEFTAQNIGIIDLDVIKRQTNMSDKEDIIYVHVEGENADFSVVRNYRLLYILYNEGWMLEEVEPYADDKNYDRTIPLHGVSEDVVSKDFSEACQEVEFTTLSFQQESVTYSNVENTNFDEWSDSYYKELQITHELFTKKVGINIVYVLNGFTWNPEIFIDEIYELNDNISGHWSCFVPAGHPMHKDSTISADIIKEDNTNCSYNFLWTSRIAGGYDQSFSGSKAISINLDDNGNLRNIVIAYDSVEGYILITPSGLVYEPAMSANGQYILTK